MAEGVGWGGGCGRKLSDFNLIESLYAGMVGRGGRSAPQSAAQQTRASDELVELLMRQNLARKECGAGGNCLFLCSEHLLGLNGRHAGHRRAVAVQGERERKQQQQKGVGPKWGWKEGSCEGGWKEEGRRGIGVYFFFLCFIVSGGYFDRRPNWWFFTCFFLLFFAEGAE